MKPSRSILIAVARSNHREESMAPLEKSAVGRFRLVSGVVGRALPGTAVVLGATLFPLTSILFVFLGQVNADEGWYLYASRLVYTGQLPYRDFAYTQTPLLPYVYGAVQTLFPSIYLGRVTSVLFSTMAFFLSLVVARNHGGRAACVLTALLGVTFTYGIYFQSITKTYALTTFLFMVSFFALSSKIQRGPQAILATIAVLLATLTRLSALAFAVPLIIYAWTVSRTRVRLVIAALCLLAAAWVLLLAVPNLDAATWGLFAHHISQWRDASIAGRAVEVLSARLPWLFIVFPGYFFLAAALLSLVRYRQIIPYLKGQPTLGVIIAGLLLFALSNLVSGGFHAEYYVPFVFVSLPIVGVAYTRIFSRQSPFSKMVMNGLLLSALVLGVVRGGFNFVEFSTGRTPVGQVREVAAIVAENSAPEDRIFCLEALTVAVEADRQPMPNTTMAQFSLYDGDTATANRLHLINGPIALEAVEAGIPQLVILTDADWILLRGTSSYDNIVAALKENYHLLYRQEGFGQFDGQVQVHVRTW
jgi:hypothetical protein